jgi:hypothetical protein
MPRRILQHLPDDVLVSHLYALLMLGIAERTGHIATTKPQEHGRSACIEALALQGIEYLVDFFHHAIGHCHHYPALLSQYKAVIALRVYDA